MKAERHARINELFDAAVDLDPAERAEFLRNQCGDDKALANEVLALMKGNAKADKQDFLRPAAMNVQGQLPANQADKMIGCRLGTYEIKKRLGSGGMGIVYLATRSEDFKQFVAIKILKRGMDSEEIVRRFRREIQVLAALGQHPNIARLVNAGTTDDGRPYFVMEYVEGEEIDSFCDNHKLAVRDRLELFKSVCSAVHFAHQHTVIHRDIKPSNILVNKQGLPKLIDFGIAKLTAPELSNETALPTSTELRVMTPEYASPEQVRGEAITTASDVYSLGIVLYQLLTGRRPYAFSSRAVRDVEEVVCHQDPVRPSTVIKSETEIRRGGKSIPLTPEAVGKQRKAAPLTLRRMLRGDLDNIVMMALRKEPRDRYASAGQFAVDLDRYLKGDAVVARKLGPVQRFWRTCRTYPLAASLIVAALLGAAFGLAYLSRLSQDLVRSAALDSAAQQAEMLYHGHKYYTNVLGDIRKTAPEAAAELKPPATFTIELFEYLNQSKSEMGTLARLRSRYPFTNRQGRKPLDEFEENALSFFENDGGTSYHHFEQLESQPYLRYTIAMRMEQSCCDCHNTHPNSTKRDWEPGQVRGVIEVIRPLANDTMRTYNGLQSGFGWMLGIVVAVFGATAIVLRLVAHQ